MTLDELKKTTAEILSSAGNVGKMSELLTGITDGYGEQVSQASELATEVETLKAENEELKQANMKLFLRVGETQEKEDNNDELAEEEPPSFENLFDENGNLI